MTTLSHQCEVVTTHVFTEARTAHVTVHDHVTSSVDSCAVSVF